MADSTSMIVDLKSQDVSTQKRDRVMVPQSQELDGFHYKSTAGVKRKKRFWIYLVLAFLIIIRVLASISTFAISVYYEQQLPMVDFYMQQSIPQNSRIYDRNNVLLYDSYDHNAGGRRVPVKLQDVPKVMQDAMVAIEDKTFWKNGGIDILGILRAALSSNGGASTLTQQVVKNLSHNDQHTLARKFQEALLAVGLTQKKPKAQILETYFNIASFGSFDVGVESAAEIYFHLQSTCTENGTCVPGIARLEYNDKGQRDPVLGLARASLLASMPNAPGLIDPTLSAKAKKLALDRQKVVLEAMIAQHLRVDGQLITPAMAGQAEGLMAQTDFTPAPSIKRSPHFVDWIVNQLALQLGKGDYATGLQMFEQGGFLVRTTIDVNLEEYVERAIDQHLNKPDYQYYPLQLRGEQILSQALNIHSGAVVVLDAKTGEILAMDGGADYTSSDPLIGGAYNMAAPPPGSPQHPSGRPPGATMLPIDYLVGYDNGLAPSTIVPNSQTGESFDVALSNASIPAGLQAAKYGGWSGLGNLARRLGISVPADSDANFARGSENVSLLQMTGAYQALADNGKHVQPVGILDMYDRNGQHIYHYNAAQPPATEVASAQATHEVTSDLVNEPKRANRFGEDHRLSFADQDADCAINPICQYQVAAESSNTDEAEDGNTVIGYTPDVVVGVWVGNVNGARMSNDVIGSTGAVPIWHSVIERALGWCGTEPTSSPHFRSDNIPCGPSPQLRFSANPTRNLLDGSDEKW